MMEPGGVNVSADAASARFAADVGPFLAALARHSRRLTRTRCDAEDLLQETLMHAFVGFHTFTEGTNLSAWLFRIMHNRWANSHRRTARRPIEISAEVLGDWDALELPICESAETEALKRVGDDALREAMSSLPEGVREAVYYANVLGYTYAETAAILNIPAGTVMSRSWRARERLRELLGPGHECQTRRVLARAATSNAYPDRESKTVLIGSGFGRQ